MLDADKEFLIDLINAPSPSGYEVPAAQVLRQRLASSADEIETNVMGSVHALLKGSGNAPSVLLAGHIDEIGFIVKHIDDKGFVYFSSLGGIDPIIMTGVRVDLHTASGDLRGVIGRKAIHLIPQEERNTVLPVDKLFIDLGLPADEVKDKVCIGDCATFAAGYEDFGKNMAVSRAFDDKLGTFIAARVMEEVKAAGGARCNLYVAGTVQEEIGMRGGETSCFQINPDLGISLEVTHAVDFPDASMSHSGLSCGKGVVIARGPNINPVLFSRLLKAAQDAGVPYQIEAEPRGTGTDANKFQLCRGGKAAALISVPLRYMHSGTEVVCLDDAEAAIALLTRFILDLDEDARFIPGISAC